MAEALNFDEELRRVANREPFEAFTIKLTNGESFEVTHSLQVAISPEGNAAVYLHPQRGIVHFRKNQVVSVHVNEAQEH